MSDKCKCGHANESHNRDMTERYCMADGCPCESFQAADDAAREPDAIKTLEADAKGFFGVGVDDDYTGNIQFNVYARFALPYFEQARDLEEQNAALVRRLKRAERILNEFIDGNPDYHCSQCREAAIAYKQEFRETAQPDSIELARSGGE